MAYPTPANLTVTLNSVDVTNLVQFKPYPLITDVLTNQLNDASLTIRDPEVAPLEWQEITIENGSELIFGGYVLRVSSYRESENSGVILYDLQIVDYAARFDRVVIKEEYEDKTDAYIIDDVVDTYLSGFNGSTYVNAVKTYDRKRINRMTVRELLDQLAADAGADWYCDYDKNIHFFASEESTAPFSLTTADLCDYTTSFPHVATSIRRDGTGVVNRIEIIGGNYRSVDKTFLLAGTGQDNRIIMPFNMHAPDGRTSIKVERNDGTAGSPSWTELTTLVGHIDELTTTSQALHYYQERVIEQQNPWPNLPNAARVTAKADIPLRSRVSDDASIQHYGFVFDAKIVDPNITTKLAAKLAGLGRLAESSMANVAIKCGTWQGGLRSGMTIPFRDDEHGINANYLIQRVTAKILDRQNIYYTLELGVYNPDLTDLLLQFKRLAAPALIWRDDEVLDEILQVSETLTMTETIGTPRPTGPAYDWSPADDNDPVIWSFFKWS